MLYYIITALKEIKTRMKKLSQKRKKELIKNYPDGNTTGRAFIEYLVEKKKAEKDPQIKITLDTDELNFIRQNLKNSEDKEALNPYLILYRVLANYNHWIEYYQQIFYHGIFRALASLQPIGSEIQHLHLLNSFLPKESEESRNLIERSQKDIHSNLEILNNIFLHNWKHLILVGIKNLHYYSFSLENIKERTQLDIDVFIPPIQHHEGEIEELQRIANELKKNLEYYQPTILQDLDKIVSQAIQTLSTFCNIDISVTRTTEEENKEKEEELLADIYTAEKVIK